jgi:site-specific recombinase XerD
MKLAKLDGKGFSAHTFRHSFATHMLDAGVDIHTIKTLLGHSKLETTMVYLHLQSRKRMSLISPLDALYNRNELETAPLDAPVL